MSAVEIALAVCAVIVFGPVLIMLALSIAEMWVEVVGALLDTFRGRR